MPEFLAIGPELNPSEDGSEDSETSPEESSSSESQGSEWEEVGYGGRLFVYIVLSLGVQAFLSYSGGATPTTVATLTNSSQSGGVTWTPLEIGVLGALDKVGQVVSAPLWGCAMERIPAKRLLSVTLVCNAAFSFQFGLLANKYSMFFSKFMQGVTESPNIIWGNLWTLMSAPPNMLSLWMNLGGVAAAVGTSIGLVVAGFAMAQDLPYSFTYSVQAGFLFLFWVALLLTPAQLVDLPESRGRTSRRGRRSTRHVGSRQSLCTQIRELGTNGLYILTMWNIGLVLFVTSGNQWYWPQFFRSGPWMLREWVMTVSNLLVPGIGMGMGIFIGPCLIDAKGGYKDDLGRYVTLNLIWQITAVGALGAGFSMLALGWRMAHNDFQEAPITDAALWVFWLSTIPTNFALSAQVGVQTVINVEAVDPKMKELAQGMTTSFQNLFGYAGGVLGPSVVSTCSMWLSQTMSSIGAEEPDKWSRAEWRSWQLSVSFLDVFAMVFLLYWSVWASQLVARRRLEVSSAE